MRIKQNLKEDFSPKSNHYGYWNVTFKQRANYSGYTFESDRLPCVVDIRIYVTGTSSIAVYMENNLVSPVFSTETKYPLFEDEHGLKKVAANLQTAIEKGIERSESVFRSSLESNIKKVL